MNDYQRQEDIDELCVKYTNRELAAMVLDFEIMIDKLETMLPVSLDEVLEDD